MKKSRLLGAVRAHLIAAVLMLATGAANAALVNGSILSIDAGSFFGMETGPGSWSDTQITGLNGIVLGTAQAASGSHSGAPNGSESPNIDNPWAFFGNTGMHQTTSPVSVIAAAGGSASLDFSGWNWLWNTVSAPLGTGADNGIATVTCALDCGDGDSYNLSYLATVPLNDPSGLGGINYRLNLTGTVSAIPVPAAVWLFGSGLLGLVGIARRKKAA